MDNQLSQEDLDLLFTARTVDYWRAQFRLVRFIRQNRQMLYTHEELAIRAIIREWMSHAVIRWPQNAKDIIEDDVWMVIRTQWDLAHFPLGFCPLAEAVRLARQNPHVPPPPPNYGECHALVWRVVWNLNLLCLKAGETDFFISSYDLARRIDHSQSVVFRALRRLELDHLITVCERGTRANHHGKATTYNVF